MKKRVILLLAAAAVLVGCGQKFTVQGTLDDLKFPAADSVVVEYETMTAPIKAAVQDGAFTLSGKVKKPTFAKVSTLGVSPRFTRVLVLEKGHISFKDGRAVGTPLNDAADAFTKSLNELNHQYQDPESRREALEKAFSDFVSKHKKDPCAIYAILLGNHRMTPEFLLELIQSTSSEIQNDGDIHSLAKQLKKEKGND